MRWTIALVVATAAVLPAAAQDYSYNGRKVTKEWVAERHKEFADKMIIVDGTPRLLGRQLLEPSLIPANPPSPGDAFTVDGKVRQVGEDFLYVRATTSSGDEIVVRIEGIPAEKFAEGSGFSRLCVFVRIHKEGGRAIQLYRAPEPVAFAQFADALKNGLKLVRYTKTKVWANVASGTGPNVRSSRQQIDKIIETPLP